MQAYMQAQLRSWYLFVAMAALVLMTACSSLGLSSPETFNQKALAAQSTVTAIANSALSLRQAGKLSDADRDNVVATLRSAQQGIDLATLIAKQDPAGGMTKLDTTITVLTALQAYLATKGK
jgi:hypothetical protein